MLYYDLQPHSQACHAESGCLVGGGSDAAGGGDSGGGTGGASVLGNVYAVCSKMCMCGAWGVQLGYGWDVQPVYEEASLRSMGVGIRREEESSPISITRIHCTPSTHSS